MKWGTVCVFIHVGSFNRRAQTGGLLSKRTYSWFWRLRSWCGQTGCLVRTCFLGPRRLPLAVSSHGRGVRELSSLLYQGTDPIQEGPALVTKSLTKDPTS